MSFRARARRVRVTCSTGICWLLAPAGAKNHPTPVVSALPGGPLGRRGRVLYGSDPAGGPECRKAGDADAATFRLRRRCRE